MRILVSESQYDKILLVEVDKRSVIVNALKLNQNWEIGRAHV